MHEKIAYITSVKKVTITFSSFMNTPLWDPRILTFSHWNQVRLTDFQFGDTGFLFISIGIRTENGNLLLPNLKYVS